jgi:dienelactone hydrolase
MKATWPPGGCGCKQTVEWKKLEEVQVSQTRSNRKYLWFLAGSIVILLLAIGFYTIYTLPADPAKHRYSQPYEYYLYIPRAYTAERSWPVFVGIHGSSGSGLHCWYWWQSFAEKEGYILICPTLTEGGAGWHQSEGEMKVSKVVSQVRSEYNLEEDLFLAGFSAGAQLVQGYAFRNPETVKGVAVLSPGYAFSSIMNARDIPFLVVTGDQETPRRLEASKRLVSLLEQNGFEIDYHLLPGVGHTLTDEARKLTIDFFRKVNGR